MSQYWISVDERDDIPQPSNLGTNQTETTAIKTVSRNRPQPFPSHPDAAYIPDSEMEGAHQISEKPKEFGLKCRSKEASNRLLFQSLHYHLQKSRNRRVTSTLLALYLVLVVLILSQIG